MKFAVLIALSHLRGRTERVVSALTAISMAGVTVGVMALTIVLSVMAGFETDLRDKILGSNAHIVVLRYSSGIEDWEQAVEKVRGVEHVTGVAPFIYTEMMIKSEHGNGEGIILKGIDPALVGDVVDLRSNIVSGPEGTPEDEVARQAILDNLHNPPPGPLASTEGASEELPGILVGEELAHSLKVFVGDVVHIINPIGRGVGPMGMPMPDVRKFRVAGIYYSGMYEYDTKWTYITIQDAQDFLKMDGMVTGLEVTVDDIYGVDPIALAIEDALAYPFYTRHWQNLNRNLFDALKLEKVVMGLILSLIVAVASLNIAGMMIVLVVTRSREIAILKAMGASTNQVRMVFMAEGVIIGLFGCVVGTILGVGGSLLLDAYGFPLDTDVYYLDSLPVELSLATVAVVNVAALGICFLATLYPASRASKLEPVEGLRAA
ncbi:MAG: ABC transporter permease [Myxococcota bacterium]|nr:ABC transporter permease [Myxococcota bacterium]